MTRTIVFHTTQCNEGMYKRFSCDGNVSWKDDCDRRVIVNNLVLEACIHFHGFTGSFACIISSIPIFIEKFSSLIAKVNLKN